LPPMGCPARNLPAFRPKRILRRVTNFHLVPKTGYECLAAEHRPSRTSRSRWLSRGSPNTDSARTASAGESGVPVRWRADWARPKLERGHIQCSSAAGFFARARAPIKPVPMIVIAEGHKTNFVIPSGARDCSLRQYCKSSPLARLRAGMTILGSLRDLASHRQGAIMRILLHQLATEPGRATAPRRRALYPACDENSMRIASAPGQRTRGSNGSTFVAAPRAMRRIGGHSEGAGL